MAIGCVICTEEFSLSSHCDKNPVVLKNCGHCFHDQCLKIWLSKSKTCPVCRCPSVYNNECLRRLHLQRLSVDNTPSINNLLDEAVKLKAKIKHKDEQLKLKDEQLKQKDKQINELESAINDVGLKVKSIEDGLKKVKKVQYYKSLLNHAKYSNLETALAAGTSTSRSPSVRTNRATITGTTTSTRVAIRVKTSSSNSITSRNA